jgi:HTH-type transcriptional regulator/antitoxin HigA
MKAKRTPRMTTAVAATLHFATPRVLRGAREYAAAVAEIDRLLDMDPVAGTEDHERLEFLSVLVEAYEDDHDPVDESGSPREVVAFMLEQRGMTRADLVPLLGSKSRVSEFLSGKRPLSIAQIKTLRDALGIPADLLLE